MPWPSVRLRSRSTGRNYGQADTDSLGANVEGSSDSTGVVPFILVFQRLGGQRLSRLDNVAEVVKELTFVAVCEGIGWVGCRLILRCGYGGNPGSAVCVVKAEVDDLAGPSRIAMKAANVSSGCSNECRIRSSVPGGCNTGPSPVRSMTVPVSVGRSVADMSERSSPHFSR